MTLLLTVSTATLALAVESSGTYTLDVDKADSYELEKLIKNVDTSAPQQPNIKTTETTSEDTDKITPKVITEATPTGRIEKLVDVDGRVIAEKTIENDTITKKVLNYYYPDGTLMRQIVAKGQDTSFYAEEYYNNGKLAVQATYINEANKIGKEKRYDANGTLRQEIPWILPDSEKQKPLAEQKTIRYGDIITYYPNGNVAAKLTVGKEGKSIFYGQQGMPIKTVEGAPILNFAQELTAADCQDVSLQLDLDGLIELYEDEGDISYNKCGMPYRESFIYEVLDAQGKSAAIMSYDETGMLRRITPYSNGWKNGTVRKYDAAGNLTAEINYKNGLKEGYATGYFPNNNPAFLKKYENGKIEGNMNCYFPDGKIAAQFYYKNGLKEGKAVVNSPIQKTLEFSKNELLNEHQKKSERQLNSVLKDLTTTEAQCLNTDKRLSEIQQDIDTNLNAINEALSIKVPEECTDMGKFTAHQGLYFCYNADKKRIATYPIPYIRGDYVVEKVYTPEDKILYDIPFKDKQRQGWAKKYDEKGGIIAEIYYDKGSLADTSRAYYPDGRVRYLQTISDDKTAKVIAVYDETGILQFSQTYKQGEKQDTYILSPDKRKGTVIKYYENKPDSIRESNTADPYNFIEYNLALGEYAVYQDNKIVKGGYLCNKKAITENSALNISPTTTNIIAINEEKTEPEVEIPPVMTAEEAPLIDDAEAVEEVIVASVAPNISDTTPKVTDESASESELQPTVNPMANMMLKTPEDEQQAKLAAQNIGPIAKPDIESLADVVQKETINNESEYANNDISRTERIYYPNGNLRKTIKTKGSRTEEIKEYSKTGLLLTDYMYNQDNIIIEKYFGSGQVRRRTEKSYNDNSVLAFNSRQDFYDTGKSRYTINRKDNTLLFNEQTYYSDGTLKSETEQTEPLSFYTKEYDNKASLLKETEQKGTNILIKEYDAKHQLKRMAMNDKELPLNLADNSQELFADNAKLYNSKGQLDASFSSAKDYNEILSYYGNGKVKTEMQLFNSGEISVKHYNSEGTLDKFALLSPDGKLHIEKPEMRIIPSYRERYWVDYNNPNWIENQEKYNIKSIARLNVNMLSKIMGELNIEEPEIINILKKKY